MSVLDDAKHFDLHLHSARSDGACCPAEVLERCAEGGLQVVSLTDHDLSTPITPGEHRLGSRTLHVLGGAEISGVHAGREYHLLVYFRHGIPNGFRNFCEERARSRAERYQGAVDSLDLPGLPPADEAAWEGERALTRHHLARALVEAGHARDVRDAFRRYADHAHGHVERVDLPFVDAIRIARSFGGVTSWAHPPLGALKQHLPEFVGAGLQGLEGLRPTSNAKQRKKVRRLARQHGLFLTGGSDWHGWTDPSLGLFRVDRQDVRGFLDALDAAS